MVANELNNCMQNVVTKGSMGSCVFIFWIEVIYDGVSCKLGYV